MKFLNQRYYPFLISLLSIVSIYIPSLQLALILANLYAFVYLRQHFIAVEREKTLQKRPLLNALTLVGTSIMLISDLSGTLVCNCIVEDKQAGLGSGYGLELNIALFLIFFYIFFTWFMNLILQLRSRFLSGVLLITWSLVAIFRLNYLEKAPMDEIPCSSDLTIPLLTLSIPILVGGYSIFLAGHSIISQQNQTKQ